jgi:hypothetical protein
MFYSGRSLSAVVLPLFVVVAIVGYLAGHRRAHTVAPERMLTASAASVLLDYPSSWQPAAAVPAIPGLSIAHSIVLAPGGDPSHAGLIVGQLLGGEPSPLPPAFIALLKRLPETQVANLLGNQAYRYSGMSVPGFAHQLTLYTIPNPGGQATALACYSPAGSSTDVRTCEHIVATLTLVGQSQSYDLTPNPTYATRLSALIQTLDQQRLTMRREMRSLTGGAALQRDPARLASAFAGTAQSLAGLEPSLAAGRVQAALAASILQARDAYTAFAAAVKGEGATLTAARAQVYAAEASVDSSLANFALLGYKQA